MQAVLSSGKQASLVPMRLIALPLPPDKVEVRRGKLKRRASRRQEAGGFQGGALNSSASPDCPGVQSQAGVNGWLGNCGLQSRENTGSKT